MIVHITQSHLKSKALLRVQSLAVRLAISSRLGSQSESQWLSQNFRCAYATLHCNPSDGACVNNAWHKLGPRQVPSMGQTNWVDSTWVGHFKWQFAVCEDSGTEELKNWALQTLSVWLWRVNDIVIVLLTCRTLILSESFEELSSILNT